MLLYVDLPDLTYDQITTWMRGQGLKCKNHMWDYDGDEDWHENYFEEVPDGLLQNLDTQKSSNYCRKHGISCDRARSVRNATILRVIIGLLDFSDDADEFLEPELHVDTHQLIYQTYCEIASIPVTDSVGVPQVKTSDKKEKDVNVITLSELRSIRRQIKEEEN